MMSSVKAKRSWIAIFATVFVMVLCSTVLFAPWQPLNEFSISQLKPLEPSKVKFQLNPLLHSTRRPTTLTYHWQVTSGESRPDGVLKRVYLVNGEFPGPTIEARSGDRIIVEVENALLDSNENISIHWHGLSMYRYNGMDGAVGVTQDAISPGHNFTYDFEIADDQAGTFWYHAHSGVQRADGLYGGLVVHRPISEAISQEIPNERLLMIGDWYHRSAEDVLGWYLTADSFGMEPVPDSILVNGYGHFPCKNAVPARPLDCLASGKASSLVFDNSKANRLRVINVGAYAGLSIGFGGSEFNVISVDGGNPVDSPASDSVGVLYPGERADLLIDKWISAKPPKLSVSLSTTSFKYSNPALDSTQSFPVILFNTPPTTTSSRNSAVRTAISLSNLTPQQSLSQPIPDPDLTLVLYTTTEKLAHLDYVPHGTINRTIWQPQSPPLISVPREAWDSNQFIPHIPFIESKPLWVDLVVNNLDEEPHPFHLHGHDFYVMSTYSSETNWGSYNPFDEDGGTKGPPGGPFVRNPLRKDTVAIPRRGYAVLRFRADNPGIWMFHCHVVWHLAGGMAMGFEVS